MKQILSGTAVGLALLVFTAAASAQQYGGRYYGGGNYSQPYVQPQYYQNGYSPNHCDPYANLGGYFNYSTPSFGLGIYFSPSYGPSIGIYSGSSYGRSYYPAPYSGGYGYYQPHYHHHYR